MVGFHLLYLEMLTADRTDTALAFVDLTLGVVVESTNAKVVDVMVEDILEYAGLALHVGVKTLSVPLHRTRKCCIAGARGNRTACLLFAVLTLMVAR